MKKAWWLSIGFLFFIFNVQAQFKGHSVLAEGTFYKVSVQETGMYKITASLLRNLGINLSVVDARRIKVFGGAVGMLPEHNSAPFIDDLIELPTHRVGLEDGKFDETDYILFFGESPHAWQFNDSLQDITTQLHLYSNLNYYFINIDGAEAKSIPVAPAGGSWNFTNTTYLHAFHYEIERNKDVRGGRRWFGNLQTVGTEERINFDATGIYSNGFLRIRIVAMSRSVVPGSGFLLSLNGKEVGTLPLGTILSDIYAPKGSLGERNFVVNTSEYVSGSNLTFGVRLIHPADRGATGSLDFLSVRFQRNLQLYENQVHFGIWSGTGVYFPIDNETIVWDITNRANPWNVTNQAPHFSALEGFRYLIAFKGNRFPTPTPVGRVPNQNLHGLKVPELVIISGEPWLSEAHRLANFRRQNDGLQVAVVTPQQIYNEFSGGKQDVCAIRNFLRSLYVRSSGKDSLRYVLLFGDASFDYKGNLPSAYSPHLVPTYQSHESLSPIFSFNSDDYYVLLEPHEGNWSEKESDIVNARQSLDAGIGRLPVSSLEEARHVVNKLIHYETKATFGKWRNEILFVADDGDANLHQFQGDKFARFIESVAPQYHTKRLFVDAYPRVSQANNRTSPLVREKLEEQILKGALIINFNGHGSEDAWCSERILERNQIPRWTNLNNMPLFLTATCEFGRFDNPGIRSGAEEAILNGRGGAIALLTTTRPVYSSSNEILSDAFYSVVFEPVRGEMPRLGDILMRTKNISALGTGGKSDGGVINRNFTLLGDPSMRLAYPKGEIRLLTFNGKSIGNDTLKALQKVTMTGEILYNGQPFDFQGVVDIVVFDKPTSKQTLALFENARFGPFAYRQRENKLFSGKTSVRNGKFSFSFVVPKNIFQIDSGKIQLYAYDTLHSLDANGAYTGLLVGGSDNSAEIDVTPPRIQLFMENENFVNGSAVGRNTELIIKLFDENGINISQAGVGQNIVAILDDDEANARILNENYIADLDTYKSGTIRTFYQGLSIGKHRIKVIAWDTHNNPSEATIDFVVSPLSLYDVVFYPNPANGEGVFRFLHNNIGEDLNVEVEIFSSLGEIVRRIHYFVPLSSEIVEIPWEGTSFSGMPLRNGIYFYRIRVLSAVGNAEATSTGKLLIVH
ncbi:MAG: type IX secretion system sortase PorU [Cytophagales bacterium]|nr:type IX secretion system sortase PorU [Cytophagales bacterium]MDW8384016.1 type IX secretion system sortase PorU [Flammeovirgaceae bacterium]